MTLPRLNLSIKLPMLIGVLCISLAISIGAASQWLNRAVMLNAAHTRLETAAQAQSEAVAAWFDAIENDLVITATNPTTRTAITWFGNAFRDMGEVAEADLRAWYIDQNPNPAEARYLLDRSEEPGTYNYQHGVMHPFFRLYLQEKGYEDIFLFDLEGNIVYTVAKGRDYATNVLDGPYAQTALQRAFQSALTSDDGSIVFFDFAPYTALDGAPTAFLSTLVLDENGAPIGVLAYQLPGSSLTQSVEGGTPEDSILRTYILGSDGLARSTNFSAGGSALLAPLEALPQVEAVRRGVTQLFSEVRGLRSDNVVSMAIPLDVAGARWGLIVEEDLGRLLESFAWGRNAQIVIALVGSLVAILLGTVFARQVTQPIKRTIIAMDAVAGGNYAVAIADTHRRDELGKMANALADLQEQLRLAHHAEQERLGKAKAQQHVTTELASGLNRLATGDLTRPIHDILSPEHDALRQNFNTTLSKLGDTVSAIEQKSQSLRNGTDTIASASGSLARRTETMAATLEQAAAAIDELSRGVHSAAQGAKSVEGIVTDARTDATKSIAIVDKAVEAMTEIEMSSDKISQIIGVIDDIAFQTNLLALNAGVEAARAGDAGRGFAVVASEVRGLAQRSSEAAKQIKTLITSSAVQVTDGVRLVGETGQALAGITQQVKHISTLVSGIANGAAEQASTLGEINASMAELGRVTQENASMVSDVSDTGRALHQDTQDLVGLVAYFRVKNPSDGQRPNPPVEFRSLMSSAPPVPMSVPAHATARAILPSSYSENEGQWQDF